MHQKPFCATSKVAYMKENLKWFYWKIPVFLQPSQMSQKLIETLLMMDLSTIAKSSYDSFHHQVKTQGSFIVSHYSLLQQFNLLNDPRRREYYAASAFDCPSSVENHYFCRHLVYLVQWPSFFQLLLKGSLYILVLNLLLDRSIWSNWGPVEGPINFSSSST